MNVRKRGLALLMCICMIFTLLPFSAFAEETTKDVVYGTYDDNGEWTQSDAATDTVSYNDGALTLTKTATKKADNTYQIDLKVVTTQTESTNPPGSAAAVLVIDVSGSMAYCAECGEESHNDDHRGPGGQDGSSSYDHKFSSRIAAAMKAAIEFLDSYKGDTAGTGRYVSLVTFGTTASVVTDWVDVSVAANYTTITNAINNLTANGGTNLEQGLAKAQTQLTNATVKDLASKNVIALTDGQPTCYGAANGWSGKPSGTGSSCNEGTFAATKTAATNLKATGASLYTVCFGASSDEITDYDTITATDGWGNNTYGTITVGDYLAKKIATAESYAYSASNTQGLLNAFKAITEKIISGISEGVVTDPMGTNVSVIEKPDNFVSTDRKTYTWELSGADGVKEGSKTTYTYTLSYTVELNNNADGFSEDVYYPANDNTTFTSGGNVYKFNVPGVKGTLPVYTVTYNQGANGNLVGQDEKGNVVHNNVKKGTATPDAPTVTPNAGYKFTGWNPAVADTVTKTITYTAQYEKLSNLSYTVNYYWNGTTDKVADSKTVGNQTFEATATEDPITIDGYTAVRDEAQTITIGADSSKNVINFYYYKNVELTASSATFTYDGTEHSVSGFTGAPDGADFSAITVGATGTNAGTYPAKFAESTVKTVDATAKYIVTKATDGQLVITPIDTVTVTITGNTSEVTYNGAEQSVSGYTVSIDNKHYKESDFTFTGTASVAKTDVGEYAMGLSSDQFTNNNNNFSKVVFVVTDGSLTIKQKDVTFTGETKSLTYTGAEQELTGITQSGLVEGHTFSALTYSAKGKNVGTYGGAFSGTVVIKDAQGNDVTKNYNATLTPGALTITNASIAVTFTGESKTVTYNGQNQSIDGITPDGLLKGHTYSGLTYLASGKNVGTYDGEFTGDVKIYDGEVDVTENYVITQTPGKLTINPYDKEVVVTITGHNDTRAYNGTAQTVTGYEVSIADELYTANDFEFTGNATASGITVGTYNMNMKPEQFSNTSKNFSKVTFNVTDGWLKITPIGSLVITANSASKTYDGTPLTNNGYTFTQDVLKEGDTLKAVVEGTITDAGTAANKVVSYTITRTNEDGTTTDVTASYNTASFEDGTLTVNKRAVTLTSETASKAYDGTALTKPEVTFEGSFVDGEVSDVKATGSVTYVSEGTVTNTIVFTAGEKFSADNYEIVKNEGKLSITNVAEALVVTADSASKVYDGTALTKNSYKLTSGALVDGDELAVVVEGSQTDAGESANVVKSVKVMRGDTDVTANYTIGESVNGTLTVSQKPVTVTAEDKSKVYGAADPELTAKVEGTLGDDTVKYELSRAAGENVGSYVITASGEASQGNYAVTYKPATLTISKAETALVVTADSASKVYDGTALTKNSYKLTSGALVDGDEFAVVVEGSQTDAGESANVVKSVKVMRGDTDVTANYTIGESVDGTLTITKRAVTLTSGTDAKVYDGTALTNKDVTVSGDGFAAGEGASYDVTGSQTVVGSSENKFSYTLSENTKADNYDIKTVNGTLKVTPVTDEVVVKIVGNTGSFVYDGTEKTVSRYEIVYISSALYAPEYIEFNGKAEAKGTDVGTYPMNLKSEQFTNTNTETFTNVKFVVEDGSLTITQMPITITAESATGAYILGPITSDKWTNTETAKGDTVVSVKITGKQETLGESANVPSDAVIKNADGKDVTANYKIDYVNGVLKGIELLEKLEHFNYVIGYPDGSVKPDANISRAEVATIFFRLLTTEARDLYSKTTCDFTDIKDGQWYTRAIATLANAGIVDGYPDGTFNPNAPITRAEMATIIARFAKLDVNTKTFNDINGHWAQKYIELAAGNNWINGYEDGSFRPNQNITRAETFAMINRVLEREVENVVDLLNPSEMNMWTDNLNTDAWYYIDVQEATNYHKCDRIDKSQYEKWTAKIDDIDWASYQI